jgi:4'-phosphopantetheinyl transferase
MSPDQGPAVVAVGAVEVEVWTAQLGDDQIDEAVLSDEELARAEHLRHVRDRVRFLAARTILRRLLSGYGAVAPEAIVLAASPAGKPSVKGVPGLHFSHARSGDLGAFAFAAGPVGVDVERIRPFAERDLVAEQFFSQRERAHLRELRDEAADTAFFRCWTRKEAYLKAVGLGIAHGLAAIDVDPAGAGPVAVAAGDDRPAGVVADVHPGLAVATAPSQAECSLHVSRGGGRP